MKFALLSSALGICAFALGTLVTWRSEFVTGEQKNRDTRRSEPAAESVASTTSSHESDAARDPSPPSMVEPTPIESSQGFAFGTNTGAADGGGYLGGFCGSLGALGGDPIAGRPSAGASAQGVVGGALGGALGGSVAPAGSPLTTLPVSRSPKQ